MVTVVEEPQITSEHERKPKKNPNQAHVLLLLLTGRNLRLKHSFVDLKTDHVLKDKTVDEEKGSKFSRI